VVKKEARLQSPCPFWNTVIYNYLYQNLMSLLLYEMVIRLSFLYILWELYVIVFGKSYVKWVSGTKAFKNGIYSTYFTSPCHVLIKDPHSQIEDERLPSRLAACVCWTISLLCRYILWAHGIMDCMLFTFEKSSDHALKY